MAATPHLTARVAVLVLSLAVTALATRWAMATRGFPGHPRDWPRTFLQRVTAGFRSLDRETALWTGMGLYAIAVAVLHFGGMRLDVYTAVHWWDVLTHTLSGVGVAVLLLLTFPGPDGDARPTGWLVPAVLAFGAGFEVYEFVFKDFWFGWPFGFYVVDTVVDLVAGAAGAGVVAVAVTAYRRLTGRSVSTGSTAPE